MRNLMAGCSKVKITPPVGTPLDGNVRDRGCEGVHDDIYAKSLVLSDGEKEIAIVSCALCAIPGDMVKKIRKIVKEKCALPEENILICTFHTHSGPSTGVIFKEVNEDYLFSLPEKIALSICEAKQNIRKVEVKFGSGEENALPHNRRIKMKDGSLRMNWEDLSLDEIDAPAGPVDPEVGVVIIEELNGKPIATLINYTCHPAILAGDNFLVSEDYPGYTMRLIEKEKGGICLFTNGAAGNINHINIFDPDQRRGFYEAERLGTILGKKVLSIISTAKPIPIEKLKMIREEIELPLRKIPISEIEKAKKLIEGKEVKKISMVDGLSDEVYAEQILTLSKIQEKSVLSEIQAISLGNIALASIPGELFVEYGLEIKKKSPFPHTFIIGYANDYVGYIPTSKAFEEGGYEVRTGIASKLDPGVGEFITKKALEILNKLKESSNES